MKKLYEERASARGETVDSNQLLLFLERSRYDTFTPHRFCWCFAVDDMFFEDGVVAPAENRQGDISELEADFCTRLWSCLANAFWASCCGCWCQCCSICAVAQEEREVNRLTGNEDYTMDYVTFQVSYQYMAVAMPCIAAALLLNLSALYLVLDVTNESPILNTTLPFKISATTK